MKYLIIIEKTTHIYSAYVPDVPGCVATGNTKDEARQNVVDALELHIEGLMEDGLPIPASKSEADYIVAH
jgi:predicted RNase H-like HicB family nuclease